MWLHVSLGAIKTFNIEERASSRILRQRLIDDLFGLETGSNKTQLKHPAVMQLPLLLATRENKEFCNWTT